METKALQEQLTAAKSKITALEDQLHVKTNEYADTIMAMREQIDKVQAERVQLVFSAPLLE